MWPLRSIKFALVSRTKGALRKADRPARGATSDQVAVHVAITRSPPSPSQTQITIRPLPLPPLKKKPCTWPGQGVTSRVHSILAKKKKTIIAAKLRQVTENPSFGFTSWRKSIAYLVPPFPRRSFFSTCIRLNSSGEQGACICNALYIEYYQLQYNTSYRGIPSPPSTQFGPPAFL